MLRKHFIILTQINGKDKEQKVYVNIDSIDLFTKVEELKYTELFFNAQSIAIFVKETPEEIHEKILAITNYKK